MEPLNLQSGRFLSRPGASEEERIRALEAHLSDVSAELEYLFAEIHAALERLESASVQGESGASFVSDTET